MMQSVTMNKNLLILRLSCAIALLFVMVLILDKRSENITYRPRRLHGEALMNAIKSTNHFEGILQQASNLIHHPHGNDRDLSQIETQHDSAHRRVTKKDKKGKKVSSPSCSAQLATCQAQLAAPQWLFVQMAHQCQLSRSTDGDFTFSITNMHKETWAFTDRPLRLENTLDTAEFMTRFGTEFAGDSPNGAFTLVHESENMLNGPLVAVMVQAMSTTSPGEYSFELKQSPEQASVYALDDFFDSSSGDAVSPMYADCSIFIDGLFSCGGFCFT